MCFPNVYIELGKNTVLPLAVYASDLQALCSIVTKLTQNLRTQDFIRKTLCYLMTKAWH